MDKKQTLIIVSILGAVFLWVTAFSLAVSLSVRDLKAAQFRRAHQEASIAALLFWPIEQTVGKFSAEVHLVGESLQLLASSTEIAESFQLYLPQALAGDSAASPLAQQLTPALSSWNTEAQSWLNSYQKASLLPKLIRQQLNSPLFEEALEQPDQLKTLLEQAVTAAQYSLQGQHRFVILLQNSDELRATGGFMGSYASVQLDDGVVTQLHIQDIYQPDGQFTGFVEPPAGAKEFLSGGKGFRLPDANWNPDFPASAQEIMQFFAFGKENQVEGVVAINVNVVEELLNITGPIYLPDYAQTVTSDNLSSLARADRNQFFPGSQQKRQFLQALFTQLKLRLAEVVKTQPEAFAQLLISQSQQKQLQAFALAAELQSLIGNLGLTGQIKTFSSPRYFYLVESNVGINKANRLVTRQVTLQLNPTESIVQLNFINQNPITSLKNEFGDYINYQRILVPPSYRVHQLTSNGKVLDHWDESLIITTGNEQLKQIGFLVTVPAKASASAELHFAHPTLPYTSLTIQKQSGLSPTPYHIKTPAKIYDLLLEQDAVLSLD